MISRRRFLAAAVLLLCAGASAIVLAQPAARLPRIGVLTENFPPPREDYCLDALRAGLRDVGLIDGRNVVLEPRWSELGAKPLKGLAADLVRNKVDVIVVATNGAAVAAKTATNSIPIVMGPVSNVEEVGLVASLARPGGNITGHTLPVTELVAKRLEMAKELFGPKIALLINANTSDISKKAFENAIRDLALTVPSVEISRVEEFADAFQRASRSGAKAIVTANSPLFARNRKVIGGLALKHRLPVVTGDEGVDELGYLAYYGTPPPELCRAAAKHVDRILKGAKPADLPVERPTKITLVVNRKTAVALGLKLPQSFLIRADRVIE